MQLKKEFNNDINNNNQLYKSEKLLKQICKCKGTLKYVHESCLIKWLTQVNS
jgi:E3 ubiquitin-protein ligase DOA10